MRRRLFALAVFVLVGCASEQAAPAPDGVTASNGGATGATGATGSPVGSLCDNSYYPAVDGASWSYRIDASAGPSSRYTDTVTEVADDGFVVTTRFPGLKTQARWSCGEQGLVSLAYGGGPSVSLTTLGAESSFESKDVAGVTIPASLAPGDTWRQTFLIHGEAFLSEDVTALTDGTVKIAFEALGIDEVTVPAGTFPALQVSLRVRLDLTIDMGDGAAPFRTTVTGSSWFAEGIGMVKASSEGDLAGTTTTSETVLTGVRGGVGATSVGSSRR